MNPGNSDDNNNNNNNVNNNSKREDKTSCFGNCFRRKKKQVSFTCFLLVLITFKSYQFCYEFVFEKNIVS